MTSNANLKAIEKAAFEGEKKRLAAEKKEKKTVESKAQASIDAEEAALRGIAKARGKPFVSEKTKKRVGKVGGLFKRAGKMAAKGGKRALEIRAANIAEEERKEKKRIAAKKAAATRKKTAAKKKKPVKRKVKK